MPDPHREEWALLAASSITALALVAGWLVVGRAVPIRPAAAATVPVAVVPTATADPCATPGVHLTVDGAEAAAPARSDRDLAGHKYRRDGSRSPWFTVEGGPLYVHAVGDFLPGDVGHTRLSLFTIITKGETDGYALARGGKSLFEVSRSDGQRIAGRFEADMSKVADTTREPPFGTPVVRVRGTFCLRALPANPKDTGP
jgi:hypothetical protein